MVALSKTPETTPSTKRSMYDSVFKALMSEPENLPEVYLALYPEARGRATVDDIQNVTIANVFYNAPYNDLSFLAEGRRIVMVEAQSTWSENIVLRIALYALHVLDRYIADNKLDIYRKKALDIPAPDFYVLYTGDGVDLPQKLRLSDSVFAGKHSSLEAEATVICTPGNATILNQYISFCKTFREQAQQQGNAAVAIAETLRICQEKGYLVPFLANHRSEVEDIMMTIFSQEYATEAFRNTTYEEGALAQALNTVRTMLKLGKFSEDDIAASVPMPVEEVRKIKAEMGK